MLRTLASANPLADQPHAVVSADVIAICALVAVAILILLLQRASKDRQRLARATAQLARSKQELQATAEAVPAGIFRVETDSTISFANERLSEILGLDVMSATTVPLHSDDFQVVMAAWHEAQASHTPFRAKFRVVRPDGEIRWVDVECRALLDSSGALTGWVGSCWDATDELSTMARLQRLSEILEATPDLVAMTDTRGRLTHANTAMRARFGIPVDGPLPPIDYVDLYAPYERQRFLSEVLSTADRDEVWQGEIDLMLFDGTTMPVSQVIVAHRHHDGRIDYYSSITRDLSEQRMYEAQLAKAEWYDPVTGLPNRAFFMDSVSVSLDRSSRAECRLAVMLVDIDHFKLVNDSLGHAAGDEMLRAVAARLRIAAGAAALLARFGSDEFCLLVEDVDADGGPVELADRIAAQLSAPIEIDGDAIFVTVSTGIAMSSATSAQDSPEALLRDADAALHRAKDRGRARSEMFIEDFRHTAVNQLRTASDLHRALDGGEFRIVYQPEVDLRNGHIVGVEALVRWHHPERGLVPPAEFIPLAEQTGLITGIGSWVLRSSIAQAAEWSTSRWNDTGLLVWVNLSARQLGDSDLVEEVATALKEYDVAPHQLGLEITETALLQDAEGAVAALGALRSLGVRLAIDDFGTGYSSLSYLKRLPVDAVKVDRSFVDGLALDGDDSAIVAAVTGMARALRLTTIAEGVESIDQLFALRRLGCDLAQGFFFTTPQPPERITRLLEDDHGLGLFSYADHSGNVTGLLPRPRGETTLPSPPRRATT